MATTVLTIIGNIQATINGLGSNGNAWFKSRGGVDVWSDGSYEVYATDVDSCGAVAYATGMVTPRQSRKATVLAVCRQIVDDHGTDVLLDSTKVEVYA